MYKIPKISCIITTYNRALYLKEAIDSVLSQRFDLFELIVIDDGSTDQTESVIKQYKNRLRYVFQPHRGASAARNLGLEISVGKYIAYLDSDDLWDRRKLSIQSRFLDQNPDYCLCYTNEIWLRNGIRVNQGKRHRKYSGYIFIRCLPLCIISPSSAMVRRKILEDLGGFDENLPAAEDYDLWLRITSSHPVYLIPIPLITKRGGHPDQLSKTIAGIDKYRIKALLNILSSGQTTKPYQAYANDIMNRVSLNDKLAHFGLTKNLHENPLRKNVNSYAINSSPECLQAAWSELSQKCRIYGNGCLKHDRHEEASYYLSLPWEILDV
ncbi:glycosyltransferase [bacterium]|nr:glycosyltransferase [bacterium]